MGNHIDNFEITKFKSYYHYKFGSDYKFIGHRHGSYEINLILHGELEVISDEYVSVIKPGDMIITEANVFHNNRVLSSDGVEFIVIMFYTDDIPLICRPRIYKLTDDQLSLFRILIKDIEANDNTADNSSKKLLEVLLSKLIVQSSDIQYINNKSICVYNKVIEYFKNNIDKKITINELARLCETSATPLKKIFSQYTGIGINRYFNNLKIHTAKNMLKNGYTISEVSEKLGFSSQAYFSQVFKKTEKKTPLEYKKSIINTK